MARRKIELCTGCATEIPFAARDCVGCGMDVGFPNVRFADDQDEQRALHGRLRTAQASATAKGCHLELENFGTAATDSEAVISLQLSALDAWVSISNKTMVAYHAQVRSGARLPSNNEYDENRIRVESAVLPYGVHENINFAALTLDRLGVRHYGDYSVTLNDRMIAKRASVFEENPFIFYDKFMISSTSSLPSGYRASWSRRSELAMAKLHPKVAKGMSLNDFPSILIDQGVKSTEADFIEVHIYGPIHPRAINNVSGPVPKDKADKIIWKRVKRELLKFGATVKEA
ncbi:hypothetical protein [Parasphingorhabdus sp.]|uniref:hypothetical protein n=1 Tax=Parasphingorhabdus sp. TaxID=2709688 RepID=UPI002B27BCBC|nr:hypothetical protein [Parasphingorhabdus sp.]